MRYSYEYKRKCVEMPDNCTMETFFGRLKNEMYYGYEKDYASFKEFEEAISNLLTCPTGS